MAGCHFEHKCPQLNSTHPWAPGPPLDCDISDLTHPVGSLLCFPL